MPLRAAPLEAEPSEAVASALRTLAAEREGLEALSFALAGNLGAGAEESRRADRRIERARHRLRHGQIRPCRAQDRRDPVVHRNARLFRPSGRGEPWRPRHDPARRCRARAFLVGRDRRARRSSLLFAALPHRARRGDFGARLDPGERSRHRALAAEGARSLPEPPRAHHLDDAADRARRRAGDRAPRGARLLGARLPRLPSGRPARRPIAPCARGHACGR